MNASVLNLNDKASEVVAYLMDEGVLQNRVDTLDEILDMILDECLCPDVPDGEALRLARELRQLIKDLTTIRNSLIEKEQ